MVRMTRRREVSVIGSGSFGTAVANVFADAGVPTRIWGRDRAVMEGIAARHENPRYLKGMTLAPSLGAEADLDSAIAAADIVVCAIPTQKIRDVFGPLGKRLSGKWVLNVSKGIEERTYLRVSEIFVEIAPGATYAVLSGPSFAEEVVKRLPTAVTVACDDLNVAKELQRMLSTPYFRAYAATDVAGAELGGSLKNVIAIATGIASGLGLGLNAQAAIINRGIAEIIRIGRIFGASPITFLGLSGMGDLVLTCTGALSRNRRLGIALGQGKRLEDALVSLGGVAEGAFTARAAAELCKREKIEMPLTEQVRRILYEGHRPENALAELMSRELKVEWDHA